MCVVYYNIVVISRMISTVKFKILYDINTCSMWYLALERLRHIIAYGNNFCLSAFRVLHVITLQWFHTKFWTRSIHCKIRNILNFMCVCVICDEFDFWRHKPQLDGSQIYCFFVGYPWKLFSCHIVSCQNVISKALNKRRGTDANNKPTFILTFWLRLDGIHKSLIANCFYHIVIKICAWLVVRLRDLSI